MTLDSARIMVISPEITFESSGTNVLAYGDISQGATQYKSASYQVNDRGTAAIPVTVAIGSDSTTTSVERRQFPLKRTSVVIVGLLTVALAAVPKPLRDALLSVAKAALASKKA